MSQPIWIWPEEVGNVNAYAVFEGTIVDRGGKARAEISTTGEYALLINGKMAGFGQYPDWPEARTVNEHDITDCLHPGENQFVLHVWHPGLDSQTTVACEPGAWYRVKQGENTLLQSDLNAVCRNDARYQTGSVPMITPQLGYSFFCDLCKPLGEKCRAVAMRKVPEKMMKRTTEQLQLGAFCAGRLYAQGVWFECADENLRPAQRMRRRALSMRFIEEMKKGDWLQTDGGDGGYFIYDLGAETSGYLHLEMECERDTEIWIGFGEHLDDLRTRTDLDGRGFCATLKMPAGKHSYTHYFRRWGCRYIELQAAAPRVSIQHCGLIPVEYPFAPETEIAIPDALHRRIYDLCVNTLKLCAHDHYEDCPWREQALYAMDGRVQMLCGYYVFGEKKLPLGALRLLAGGQREDGLLEICAPANAPITIPGFSLVYVIDLWEYMLHTGEPVEDALFETAQRILEAFVPRLDESGCVCRFREKKYWNFYEWQPGLEGQLGRESADDRAEAPLTAWYALSLEAMIHICEKRNVNAEKYICRLNAAQNALEGFWSEERRGYLLYKDENAPLAELTQALILLTGAAPEARAQLLRKRLTEGDMIPVTLTNALVKYQALMQESEKYMPWILKDIERQWGAMAFTGATSVWETALGAEDFHRAGSLCHGWSAVPAYIYVQIYGTKR